MHSRRRKEDAAVYLGNERVIIYFLMTALNKEAMKLFNYLFTER
jgi:hypothetical protein